MQNLEGNLGLVLGVERELPDGRAEVCEGRGRRAAAADVGPDLGVEQAEHGVRPLPLGVRSQQYAKQAN